MSERTWMNERARELGSRDAEQGRARREESAEWDEETREAYLQGYDRFEGP
jgi:hypothetical protein